MRDAVSRTATVVALWRARESSRAATTRLFVDPFAPAFLGGRFQWALSLSRLLAVGAGVPWALINGHWSGTRGTVAVRTRYIDDLLSAVLRHGVDQVVILGAGFDCCAYRIQGIEPTQVFEVDHPLTQGKKQDVRRRRLGALPPHVAMIAIDFNTHTLAQQKLQLTTIQFFQILELDQSRQTAQSSAVALACLLFSQPTQ